MEYRETDNFSTESGLSVKMKVIGVGGAGSNIVDRLQLANLEGVDLAVVNTDLQALSNSLVPEKICIGKSVTGGLGSGSDLEVGREAANSDKDALKRCIEGVDLLFIATGLGGGTGTGASPVIAELANRSGALVISFCCLPFTVERAARAQTAQDGLNSLRDVCNAVIPLPNDLLVQASDEDASFLDAFAQADAWIEKAIKSLWAMMHRAGVMNIDFAQLRQAFAKKAGKTLFGLGSGSGSEATENALEDLKLCPLLHTPEFSKQADHLLVNIIGGASFSMTNAQRIMESVANEFGQDANLVMGAVIDEALGDRVDVCVIGTSDVTTQSMLRKPRIPSPTESRALPREPVLVEDVQVGKHGAGSRRKKKKTEQHEFSFTEGAPKGEFENAEGYLFEGQDLDTPTFLRKGVKIPL